MSGFGAGPSALRLGANCGDDKSDEDAFSPENNTIAVRVGRKRQSHASYFVRPQAEIDELLEQPGFAANKYEATSLRLRVL